MRRIYLDHNATTPVRPDVLREMMPYLQGRFGNASSFHAPGQAAREAVEQARRRVADLIGAEPREIIFTSGGTEADNLAIRGTVERAAQGKRRPHIVTSAIEHPAVLNTCQHLEKSGCVVSYVPVDGSGLVHPDSVARAVTQETLLVSIMLANNEIGTIQPVAEIARMAREKGVLVHTDAVQAVGRLPVDVRELGVDLLSISAHKIYGPKGVGALYVRRGVRLAPMLYGGHHERNLRAGTENVPAIAGFGKACEIAAAELPSVAQREATLRDKLERGILECIPHMRVNGDRRQRLPNTLNVGVAFVEGEALLVNLDLEGIAIATGSACSSGSLKPSHVQLAIGRSHEQAHGSLRFSLGRETTEEEIDITIEALERVVQKLRVMSPLYSDFVNGRQTEGFGR